MPSPRYPAGPSPRIPPRYRGLVMAASRATGLPSKIIATQIDYESTWNPKVTSPAGAEGIAQFEPGTWKQWGHGSPFNARDSFTAYAKYMRSLLGHYRGDVRNALAAYNAGPNNVQAGYGYADTILAAAGYGQGVHSGQEYGNPLRSVNPLTPERIDMGVDYAGTGPVYALAPGKITAAGHAWSGAVGAPYPGSWITEKITAGPLTGQQWYVAEDIYDIKVQPGQRVTAGTVLGRLQGGLETGFAAPGAAGAGGETAAAYAGQQAPGPDPGAVSTGWGIASSDVLQAVGAPPGIKGTVSGQPPNWLSGVISQIKSDSGSGFFPNPLQPVEGGLSGVAKGIGDIASAFERIAHIVDWLVNPTHWVRILAFAGGSTFVLMGIWSLTHVGGDLPGAGPITRPAALPIGVFLVGTGGILLFVAFHNLPPDVKDIGSLFGYLRTEAKGGSSLGNAP